MTHINEFVLEQLERDFQHYPHLLALKKEEEALDNDLREVSIFNNFCYFDGKIFKGEQGWA
eukprot:SAG11_NODE_7386_length_1152_cov_0.970560_1_plen_60_part_10